MGNTSTNHLVTSGQKWVKIQESPSDKPGTPLLVKDIISKTQADCYEIPLNENLNYQVNLLQKRKHINLGQIPVLLDVKIKVKGILDCSDKEILQIYMQKILCRMGDFQLNERELLMILKDVLVGFQNLYGFGGNYFLVTEKMIGFNQKGLTKVWLNQNFGCQEIAQEYLVRSQGEMVKSIIGLFQKRLDNQYNWLSQCRFCQILPILQIILKNVNYTEINRQICNKIKLMQRPVSGYGLKSEETNSSHFNQLDNCPDNHRPTIEKSIIRDFSCKTSTITSNQNKYSLKQNGNIVRMMPNQQRQGPIKLSVASHQATQFHYKQKATLIDQQNQFQNAPHQLAGQFHNIGKIVYSSQNVYPQARETVNQLYPVLNIRVNCLSNNHNTDKIELKKAEHVAHSIYQRYNRTSILRSPNRQFSSILQQSEEGEESISQLSEQVRLQHEHGRKLSRFEEDYKQNYSGSLKHVTSKELIQHFSTTSLI